LIEGRVVAIGLDGKEHWRIDDVDGPADVQVLPNGRLLIAENHGQRITERDLSGRIVWQWRDPSYPVACWRLDSGNTFVVNRDGMLEVTPEGKTTWSNKLKALISCGARLRDGGMALLLENTETEEREMQIVLVNAARQVVRRIDFEEEYPKDHLVTLVPLPNGRFLGGRGIRGDVREVDRTGKKVWQSDGIEGSDATFAVRLANGHTVIADSNNKLLLTVDQGGKVVRKHKTRGRPYHVQVLP
jgi:hypothetical protein